MRSTYLLHRTIDTNVTDGVTKSFAKITTKYKEAQGKFDELRCNLATKSKVQARREKKAKLRRKMEQRKKEKNKGPRNVAYLPLPSFFPFCCTLFFGQFQVARRAIADTAI
ncbi:hypothetical protein WN51_06978 [Melipona quadrifasciata]|uniref:Uncharacterized protein n=1 Tax=Melipona quadrifasciata TaxID=166423 RepID=A0A0N0BCJ7_9HYME|nr:hypothetical protein WN51_06978 [Melipona quadrifasciata]